METQPIDEAMMDRFWPAWRDVEDIVQRNVWIASVVSSLCLQDDPAASAIYRIRLSLFITLMAWNKEFLSEFDYESCFVPEFPDDFFE